MQDPKFGKFIRNFVLELLLYGTMVVVYFLIVLRFMGGWLTEVFNNNLGFYAALALGLVVAQAVLLDFVTSLLLDILNIERLH